MRLLADQTCPLLRWALLALYCQQLEMVPWVTLSQGYQASGSLSKLFLPTLGRPVHIIIFSLMFDHFNMVEKWF